MDLLARVHHLLPCNTSKETQLPGLLPINITSKHFSDNAIALTPIASTRPFQSTFKIQIWQETLNAFKKGNQQQSGFHLRESTAIPSTSHNVCLSKKLCKPQISNCYCTCQYGNLESVTVCLLCVCITLIYSCLGDPC